MMAFPMVNHSYNLHLYFINKLEGNLSYWYLAFRLLSFYSFHLRRIGNLVRTTIMRLLCASCSSCPSHWISVCRKVVSYFKKKYFIYALQITIYNV